MIKVTFHDLARIRTPIDNTGNTLVHLKQVGRETLFADRVRLGRLAEAIATALMEYENALGTLVDECGGVRVASDAKRVPEDRLDEFRRKLIELDKVEIEISTPQLPLSVFETTSLTSNDLMALEKFIVFPDA